MQIGMHLFELKIVGIWESVGKSITSSCPVPVLLQAVAPGHSGDTTWTRRTLGPDFCCSLWKPF